MKTTVSRKMPMKPKPGSLKSGHIEYDTQGDGATVTYMHEPEAGGKSDSWTPGPAPHKQSFSTRMEAHHHMAKMAGVNADIMDEAAARAHGEGDSSDGSAGSPGSEGDDDEDPAEERGGSTPPAAQAKMSMAAPPKRKV